jgi:hypothetical protein
MLLLGLGPSLLAIALFIAAWALIGLAVFGIAWCVRAAYRRATR